MTVYNAYEDSEGIWHFQPTVIHGVFWRNNYREKQAAKGLETTDRVSVMILKETTVEGRRYASPLEFARLPMAEKESYWTLAKEDRFVNQAVTTPISKTSELEKKFGYDNVCMITNVIDNDFGSPRMRHFKVIGK